MMFTRSADGKYRTTIRPDSIRFEKEEISQLNRLASAAGYDNYRQWLNYQIINMVDFSEEKLKEMGDY